MVLAPDAAFTPYFVFSADAPRERAVRRETADVQTRAELESRLQSLPGARSPRPSRDAQPLFRAAARLGIDAVAGAIALTKGRWAETTDMSPNDLCCLAVITFIDERAFAIAEAVNPRDDARR